VYQSRCLETLKETQKTSIRLPVVPSENRPEHQYKFSALALHQPCVCFVTIVGPLFEVHFTYTMFSGVGPTYETEYI
jgi:hypothetical protein